jgi:hypothetical protein
MRALARMVRAARCEAYTYTGYTYTEEREPHNCSTSPSPTLPPLPPLLASSLSLSLSLSLPLSRSLLHLLAYLPIYLSVSDVCTEAARGAQRRCA